MLPRLRAFEGAQKIFKAGKTSTPRLWNGKRRIKSGRLRYVPVEVLATLQTVDREAWKKTVSEDVVKFIEDAKLKSAERAQCLANPNRYFSYPANVPSALRKQVYLYETLHNLSVSL